MSTFEVARKDFQDGIRSRTLIGLVVIFAIFMAGAAYFFTEISPAGSGGSDPGSQAVIVSLLVPTYILLPLIGTVLGYSSISGERDSGSLKFLLGLPHSRKDVVFGKLIGRAAIVTIAVVVGFAIGGVALYVFTSAFNAEDYVILTAVSILLGITFVSIAIAFSSAAKSSRIATGGAITLVLLFLFLWQLLLTLIQYVGTQLSLIESGGIPPQWYFFLTTLNPTVAFQNAATALIGSGGLWFPIQNPPFYLQNWFGFVILAVWLVVPISIAYLRFRRADL